MRMGRVQEKQEAVESVVRTFLILRIKESSSFSGGVAAERRQKGCEFPERRRLKKWKMK